MLFLQSPVIVQSDENARQFPSAVGHMNNNPKTVYMTLSYQSVFQFTLFI